MHKGVPHISAGMQVGDFLLSLLCFLLMGSRRRSSPRLRVQGVYAALQLYPPHREKSFAPHLGISLCKLNKGTQKFIFWGDLSICSGDNQQISGGELVWNFFFLIYPFFLLDIFSIITINCITISSLPYVSWTPANTLKRRSV